MNSFSDTLRSRPTNPKDPGRKRRFEGLPNDKENLVPLRDSNCINGGERRPLQRARILPLPLTQNVKNEDKETFNDVAAVTKLSDDGILKQEENIEAASSKYSSFPKPNIDMLIKQEDQEEDVEADSSNYSSFPYPESGILIKQEDQEDDVEAASFKNSSFSKPSDEVLNSNNDILIKQEDQEDDVEALFQAKYEEMQRIKNRRATVLKQLKVDRKRRLNPKLTAADKTLLQNESDRLEEQYANLANEDHSCSMFLAANKPPFFPAEGIPEPKCVFPEENPILGGYVRAIFSVTTGSIKSSGDGLTDAINCAFGDSILKQGDIKNAIKENALKCRDALPVRSLFTLRKAAHAIPELTNGVYELMSMTRTDQQNVSLERQLASKEHIMTDSPNFCTLLNYKEGSYLVSVDLAVEGLETPIGYCLSYNAGASTICHGSGTTYTISDDDRRDLSEEQWKSKLCTVFNIKGIKLVSVYQLRVKFNSVANGDLPHFIGWEAYRDCKKKMHELKAEKQAKKQAQKDQYHNGPEGGMVTLANVLGATLGSSSLDSGNSMTNWRALNCSNALRSQGWSDNDDDDEPTQWYCSAGCGKKFKSQEAEKSHIKDKATNSSSENEHTKRWVILQRLEKLKAAAEIRCSQKPAAPSGGGRSNDGGEKKHFVCPACGSRCDSKDELERHLIALSGKRTLQNKGNTHRKECVWRGLLPA
ncbi:expressed unknown protein [Seminavis robusta]|uniref:Uncharacterized protein n=1 Tax=Seminavis robusta TaxID=568900 RepID=A0A9N8H1E5_9STRA|nr:expressed unknown protein [Seminavis robusta]|eukprot:Sro39_g024180.1 n/a (704) ;mRNA; f:86056-88167